MHTEQTFVFTLEVDKVASEQALTTVEKVTKIERIASRIERPIVQMETILT